MVNSNIKAHTKPPTFPSQLLGFIQLNLPHNCSILKTPLK